MTKRREGITNAICEKMNVLKKILRITR